MKILSMNYALDRKQLLQKLLIKETQLNSELFLFFFLLQFLELIMSNLKDVLTSGGFERARLMVHIFVLSVSV